MTARRRPNRPMPRGGYLRSIALDIDTDTAAGVGYPFTLPVVTSLRHRGRLPLDPAVTLFTGDNGTGKSTLIEAVAVAAGFNPEGGSRNFRFASRATESALGAHLRLSW
jgi:predicted ATPase